MALKVFRGIAGEIQIANFHNVMADEARGTYIH